jgi:hypothetical protein
MGVFIASPNFASDLRRPPHHSYLAVVPSFRWGGARRAEAVNGPRRAEATGSAETTESRSDWERRDHGEPKRLGAQRPRRAEATASETTTTGAQTRRSQLLPLQSGGMSRIH